MTTGTVTYSGLLIAKGATYSQKRGISPDRVQVRMIPQSTPIAAIGDLTLDFNAANPIVIKDALADKSHIWLTDQGFTGTIIFEDRRWRWSRYPRYSAHFNERDANGDIIASRQTGLRDMLLTMFTHIGEASVDLSRVPNDFYPEIDVQCVQADKLIGEITGNFGYEVCLGYGDDVVTVYPQGTGSALPTGSSLMAFSEEVDPPTAPEFFQVCFGPSVAQARFAMIAMGLDLDGNWKPINSLSYKPSAGWDKEPIDMPNVRIENPGTEAWNLARNTVYKVYAISTFADGTLDYPDGSGTLSAINQVLPLFDKLLETGTSNDAAHHPPVRVYGSHFTYSFPAFFNTEIGALISEPYTFDRYRGMIKFEEPMYQLEGSGAGQTIKPAELYLEAMFRIRDETNNQFVAYVWETTVDANGQGYATHHDPSLNARTIVLYDNEHAVTGTQTNQDTLDAFAATIAANGVGLYTYSARYMNWYNIPMNAIKPDGLTSQVRHVISDGEDGEPGHYTVASQNTEFDVFDRTSHAMKMDAFIGGKIRDNLSKIAAELRTVKGND